MTDWYDDLISVPKVPKVPKEPDWYDSLVQEILTTPSVSQEDITALEHPTDVRSIIAKDAPGGYQDIAKPPFGTAMKTIKESALVETAKHIAVETATFFPSLAAGVGQLIHEKGLNVIRKMSATPYESEEKYVKRNKITAIKGSPEYNQLMGMRKFANQIKSRRKYGDYKSPQEIRSQINSAIGLFTEWLDAPKTEGGKAAMELVDITLNDMVFHYPHQLDKALSDVGWPNAGWFAGAAGELVMLKAAHSSVGEAKSTIKNYMRFLDDINPELYRGEPHAVEIKKSLEQYFQDNAEDLGIPKDKLTSAELLQQYLDETYGKPSGDALKRTTKSQKIKAHKLARELSMDETARRDLAEKITGVRTMKEMNKESAGRFIEELKKEKVKPTEKPVLNPELAKRVIYNGVQQDASSKPAYHTYTDKTTGSTFIFPLEEDINTGVTRNLKILDEKYKVIEKPVEAPVESGEVIETFRTKREAEMAGVVDDMKKIVEEKKVKEPDVVVEPEKPKSSPAEVTATENIKAQFGEFANNPNTLQAKDVAQNLSAKGLIETATLKNKEIIIKTTDNQEHIVSFYNNAEAKSFKDILTEAKLQPTVKKAEVGKESIKEPISPAVKQLISDDIITAQDMGIYGEVRDMAEQGLKIGQIMKEVKGKPYYTEDLKDFGYTENDIRASVRAVKAELGDKMAIKEIETSLKKEEAAVKKISEPKIEAEPTMSSDIKVIYSEIISELPEHIRKDISIESIKTSRFPAEYEGEGGRTLITGKLTEPERYSIVLEKGEKNLKDTLRHEMLHTYVLKHPELLKKEQGMFSHEKAVNNLSENLKKSELDMPADIQRVDPETGRLPGVEVDLTPRPKELSDIEMEYELSQMPIRSHTSNNILKTKVGARIEAERTGRFGDIVKDPNSEGWLVKKTKEQKQKSAKEEAEKWEDILKEEELGDIDEALGERVDIDVDTILGNERGSITIDRETIKKFKEMVRKGLYSRNEIIVGLRDRGATTKEINKIFPDVSVRILNEDVESKWLKSGQDPLEYLPQRKLKNKMKAPAITRGEAHMIATMKDMPARLTAEHFSWENAIRTFEKLPPEVKETFYRTAKEGESLSFNHLQDILKQSKTIRNSVSYTSHKRIGIHAIAQQPDGIAVLAQQGITKIPKLKSKELKAYNDLRAIYDDLFIKINKARVAAGEKAFPKMENYFTWVQDLNWMEKTKGVGLSSNWRTLESRMAENKRVPSFRFAKFRAGPDMPRKLNLNPFTVMDVYAKSATHYIEMGPRLAKLNELFTEKFKMEKNAPNAYNFLKHWTNYQAGKIPAWDIANPYTRKAMQVLNNNVVYSLLAYNIRSALIQPAAIASSYAMLGEYYTAVGVGQIMSPSKWRMAGKKSNVLNTRSPEAAIYEAMEAGGKLPGQIQRKIAQVGIAPLSALDSVTARITWLGAYEQGLKKLKLSEQKAINYADDIVTKTQASAARSDIAPIQRTQLGKTITALQTFVINHWGFLTKEVLGIKNADITNPVRVKRVIRFLLATTAVNAFYEDVLKMNSPNPTPIRAFREEFEKTESYPKAFARGVKEIAEYVPLWGGRLRYGSELGGPAITELLKLIGDGDPAALTKLQGIPGANQFFKSVRAYERQGTTADVVMGRYIEPPKAPKSITGSVGGSDKIGSAIKVP